MRDAAKEFGVTEVEVLASLCGDKVVRLEADWAELVHQFHRLGRVMAITRNENAVIEKHGEYTPVETAGKSVMVLDEGIDLRLFLQEWHTGFAVHTPDSPSQFSRSFQFFDRSGCSVHKVFVGPDSNTAAYEGLVESHRSSDQLPIQSVESPPDNDPSGGDTTVDREALIEGWKALSDTHGFSSLLRRHRVTRTEAYRIAPPELAQKLKATAYRPVLEQSAERKIPIMIFIGNHGCTQIHSGPVKRVVGMGSWFNVLDPELDMHISETGVSEAWLVRKPVKGGVVSSVELYDSDGNEIALFYGVRKHNSEEDRRWKELVEDLPLA